MIIGVLKEALEGEFRVAATPETVKKLITLKHMVYIESNAGIGASITDQMFIDAGGLIKNNAEVFKADLLLKVRAPNNNEIKKLHTNQFIVGLLEPFNKALTTQLATIKVIFT
jgi:NAD(P) transhydrogenase subunit alpha